MAIGRHPSQVAGCHQLGLNKAYYLIVQHGLSTSPTLAQPQTIIATNGKFNHSMLIHGSMSKKTEYCGVFLHFIEQETNLNLYTSTNNLLSITNQYETILFNGVSKSHKLLVIFSVHQKFLHHHNDLLADVHSVFSRCF